LGAVPRHFDVQPGDLVSGKYRLLRQLGRGGMGSVWAARNELTDRDFAIKFLLPELAQSKDTLHRFFLEARACGQIKHPAVVAVYDMGQAEDGTPYLVMELMEGEGLDQRLARSSSFRAGEAASFVAFISRGLEEAHVRGLVHRDLKPGNIFFAIDDRGDIIPKVLDFGVTKAIHNADPKFVRTNTGAVLGSPAYMSPEQARGDEDIDGRSDVWSLGVILYETLTGRPPFDGANYNALMVAILMTDYMPAQQVNPEIPTELSEIIDLTLQKDRSKRISTARDLAERLEGVAARITGTPYPGSYGRPRSMTPPPMVAMHHAPSSIQPDRPSVPLGEAPGDTAGRRLAWASGAVFTLAVLAIGGVAIARQRPPVVAVAARAANVLEIDLLQVRDDLVKMQRETQIPAPPPSAKKPDDDKSGLVIEPEELPDSPKNSVKKKPKKTDPHGGVDSPGF
jgi:serine/threonine-protein kinase